MKNIFFDLDTTALLSSDGRARPFMDIILDYCEFSDIAVTLMVSPNNAARAAAFYDAYAVNDHSYISRCKVARKGSTIPAFPDLAISCDSDYLKKFPGLLVPPYDPDRSNRFAELAFAGTLIEQIKNKVVLNREAPREPAPSPERDGGKDREEEDFSNWAQAI